VTLPPAATGATIARRTRSLDGDGWQLRAHPGTEAALAAAARDGKAAGAIHAVHVDPVADAAAGWIPAHVPGSVVDDLMRAGEVPDLYHERNSRAAEWAADRAWTYRRVLETESLAEGERAWLRFAGIDDAGHVFLDRRPLARHDGMFVPLEVEVTDGLRRGGRHELAVVVQPAPESQPQVGRTSLVRTHKSRMTYGWDFCPRLVHQGVWGPVELITAGAVRLADVWARTAVETDGSSGRVRVRVVLDRAPGTEVAAVARVRLDGVDVADTPIGPGETVAELAFHVAEPARWWPNGLGPAALHELVLELVVDRAVVDERRLGLGFRTIERLPTEGAPAADRPWRFVVNGRQIEIKGWNWTPLDVGYGVPRPDRLDHLLGLAAASGANLVRVWGGGLIETDAFYDACDRLGLLVWQEFSQSSSGIDDEPARDEAFVARMRREAESIVPLRRNHPSLAIWCGGNELQGPDGPLETARSPVLAALAEVVDRLDPDRIWLPTTPTGPRFGNRLEALRAAPDDHHDVHGPWEHQGLREHTVLWDAGTSRFNGEFGVEGMTTRRALERLIAPDHRWPADRSNPVYRHLGDWWNNAPLVEASFAGRIADLETLRRASQHLQADGLRYALEANRRRWPRNGGSIPWQLNESFPNAWCTSVVAHDGEPKPAFHAVRRAWARTLVCARLPAFVLDGSSTLAIEPWAWSEDGPAGRGTIAVRAIDADGSVMAETLAAVELDGRRPASPGPVALELGSSRGGVVFLDLALAAEAKGEEMARNRYALGRGSDLAGLLDLPPAELDVGVERDATSWCLTLANAGSAVAAGVLVTDDRRLDAPGWGVPDDSWFDLLAGERRVVRVAWANDEPADRRLRIDGWNVAPIEVAAG
jgi:beta-mannosidase